MIQKPDRLEQRAEFFDLLHQVYCLCDLPSEQITRDDLCSRVMGMIERAMPLGHKVVLEAKVELLEYLLLTCSKTEKPEPWRALFAEMRASIVGRDGGGVG